MSDDPQEESPAAADIPCMDELQQASTAIRGMRVRGRCPTMNKRRQGRLKQEVKREMLSELRFAMEALENKRPNSEVMRHVQQAQNEINYLRQFEIPNPNNINAMMEAQRQLNTVRRKLAPPPRVRGRKVGELSPQDAPDTARLAATEAVGEMGRLGSFNDMLQSEGPDKIVPGRKQMAKIVQG